MIIIPDIHGRKFWKKAVKKHEDEEIVFLGDYCDPYPKEGIHKDLKNFDEIIAFKKKHPKNVTLLIGNHDQQYFIYGSCYCGRRSYFNERSYYQRFNENRELFQLCLEKEINGKKYLFSHAGVLRGWKELRLPDVSDDKVAMYLNNAYEVNDDRLGYILSDISYKRRGNELYGSVTWADVSEHFLEKQPIAAYQIFGHSQMNEYPIITKNFADLDVRRAFILNDKGEILEMNGEPAITFDDVVKNLEFGDDEE